MTISETPSTYGFYCVLNKRKRSSLLIIYFYRHYHHHKTFITSEWREWTAYRFIYRNNISNRNMENIKGNPYNLYVPIANFYFPSWIMLKKRKCSLFLFAYGLYSIFFFPIHFSMPSSIICDFLSFKHWSSSSSSLSFGQFFFQNQTKNTFSPYSRTRKHIG